MAQKTDTPGTGQLIQPRPIDPASPVDLASVVDPASTIDPARAVAPASPVDAVRALARASRILERSTDELNLAHYRVLAAVSGGDELASRVAARLALGKPTISSTVTSLCERGLLDRVDVAGDQRAAGLRLTAQGRSVLARAEAGMIARIEELAAHTPDAARLLEALGWLNEAIDRTHAEHRAARLQAAAPLAQTGQAGQAGHGQVPRVRATPPREVRQAAP